MLWLQKFAVSIESIYNGLIWSSKPFPNSEDDSRIFKLDRIDGTGTFAYTFTIKDELKLGKSSSPMNPFGS